MKEIEILISTITTIIGLIISTLTFFLKFIKNVKGKKNAQNFLIVCEQILIYIEEAEKFLNYDGFEKKNYVLTRVNKFVIENKINVSQTSITDKIEEFIQLTKNVNINRSSKELNKLYEVNDGK